MTDYYKAAIGTHHSIVVIICDPRYKLEALAYLFEAKGGVESSAYKVAKDHF